MIIYTAIFKNYDKLPPHLMKSKDNIRFVCFSDMYKNKKMGWEIEHSDMELDGFRKNRYYKINSHLLFKDDINVYLDPTFMIVDDFEDRVEDWLGDNDIAVMMHPKNRTVREEAMYLIEKKPHKVEDINIVHNQIKRYEKEGFPLDTITNQGGFIIRRNTPNTKRFNETWWNEVKENSRRDQLSFTYTSWKTGIKFTELPRNEIEKYTRRVAWHR